VTIETIARQAGLRFQPLQAEYYDFAIPEDRWERPAIRELRRLLAPDGSVRAELEKLGFGKRETS
jgi:molybdate-binding protein